MQLALDQEERALLERILRAHLGNLRSEISRTENYDWRQDMHLDEDRIKALIARLEAAATPAM